VIVSLQIRYYIILTGRPITTGVLDRGGSRGAIGAIAPCKTHESNFIHHDFAQFGKQHIKTKSEQVFRQVRIFSLIAI